MISSLSTSVRKSVSCRLRLTGVRAAMAIACALGSSPAPSTAQAHGSQPIPALTFRFLDSPRDSSATAQILRVQVEIAPGWHINSNAPLDEFLVPTTIEARAEGLKFGKPRFPQPERVHSEAFGGDVLLFSGAIEIEIPASGLPAASPKPAPKPPRTRVTLRYQACDHATCYAPKELTVER
jgi:hypothetical protein